MRVLIQIRRFSCHWAVWNRRIGATHVWHSWETLRRRAHDAMPGSKLALFIGAGHFPHHADPERFVSVLREFVDHTAPSVYRAADWRTLLRQGRPAPRDRTNLG